MALIVAAVLSSGLDEPVSAAARGQLDAVKHAIGDELGERAGHRRARNAGRAGHLRRTDAKALRHHAHDRVAVRATRRASARFRAATPATLPRRG
jgi:hypothetical protein